MATITGTAAGVPFTALPPAGADPGRAPLIVTWHMFDPPRSDAAFAAALPMATVPAWRVHLGMPLCGVRMVDGRLDAHVELAQQDALLAYFAPLHRQAVEEFPAALAALREQLPTDDGPLGIVGGSLGGAVALEVLATSPEPIAAAALINPSVRMRTAVGLVEEFLGPYPWTPEAQGTADRLDYVARVDEFPADVPLLLMSGEQDHPASRADAAALIAALRGRHDDAELTDVPDLAHPLAEEPGLEPAPQTPAARVVDAAVSDWFRRHLPPTAGSWPTIPRANPT